ncbi:mitochondrial import inner membrane translocase subunit TIM44-like [Tachypleus tridentatus]|uniref:mitochondrial import inner membrane translocase subunit TIM44-like n=1 Tax=Tachypleus tridentatus TaxID=6853 RepID=UPI003FD0219B
MARESEESLRKFREEAEKLEQSEALQKARKKYESIEAETVKSSQVLKEQLESWKDKLKEGIEEAQKSELGKKGLEITEEITKSARSAKISESTFSRVGVYKPPVKLRKRIEKPDVGSEDKVLTPNTEATGLELHKDSKWFQSWQNFKDNNPYVNKVFDWKMKYDESDNPVIRASRLVTDKISDIMGGLFQKTELSEVLTEIIKMDPTFEKEKFLRECELEIIPNILEAMIRGDLEILKDWCHEAPFNTLAAPIKQAQSLGYKFDSRILDISNIDLAMGKMMEQGPVLIITFQTQQIMVVRNAKGDVVEGDPVS